MSSQKKISSFFSTFRSDNESRSEQAEDERQPPEKKLKDGTGEKTTGASDRMSIGSVSSFDVSKMVQNSAKSDDEKVNFIEHCWRPTLSTSLDKQRLGSRQLSFQHSWLEQHSWLAYSGEKEFAGGWCLPCVLFLSEHEKRHLGVFVNNPFRKYNKSKEHFDGHEGKAYHKTCIHRASVICAQVKNPAQSQRIDVQINNAATKNLNRNKNILLHIVDVVLFCAKQQIALRGHRDDTIQFDSDPECNEGNFIALVRLLAESNPDMKEHLINGPQNARYTSKTIQNEIINIAANVVRDDFRKCLEINPHFALMADETTSQGKEVLSVCLRFLDLRDPSEPTKREVLLDICPLQRTTGKAIATAIQYSLAKNEIDLANCRGQAYDTTASMSSDKKGVHAEIAKSAPDADYQGCCLHSLNLVICHACKISPVRNMMDSCHELFKFFDNSPKRQNFLEVVINALAPDNRKRKLKDLCKTRWVARYDTFETLFSLYEYIVISLNEICHPSDDERFYSEEGENWSWDSNTRTLANGLRHTFASFGHIVSFIASKELLEPMRPLVSALQGRLVEVYFGFLKIDQVTSMYAEIRKEIETWYQRMYDKVLALAHVVGSAETFPRICSRQRHRDNLPAESAFEYWKRTVVIPFLDIVCEEIRCRFSQEKRAHYELCALMPELLLTKTTDEVVKLSQTLNNKWGHLMPFASALESELLRWQNLWKTQAPTPEGINVTSLLANHAGHIFFPNVRELLKVLAVLPLGSTEAERSFSCVRRVHTWLRSTMTTERLADLAVIAMNGQTVPIDRMEVCRRFMVAQPRRMTSSSLF